MKNITLSADERLIWAVRERALADYARHEQQAEKAMDVVGELRGTFRTGGRKFTREEMNEW